MAKHTAWETHPLIAAIQAADANLQLSVICCTQTGLPESPWKMTIAWMNEEHRERWKNVQVGNVCHHAYNLFSNPCTWCPCLRTAADGRSHVATALSPTYSPIDARQTLEYSHILSVLLKHDDDHTTYVLEIILVVSAEETEQAARDRERSVVLSKLFCVLSHSYGRIGLDFLLFVLVAPEVFGFEVAYLYHVNRDEDGVPTGETKSVVLMKRPAHSQVILNAFNGIDFQDKLSVAEFHDDYLAELVIEHSFTEDLPLLVPPSMNDMLVKERSIATEYGLQAAIVPLCCKEAGLSAWLCADHTGSCTYITGSEVASLSLIAAAARQGIALGVMNSSFMEITTGIMNAGFDDAVVNLAQMLALARVHEFRSAWMDIRAYYDSLVGYLPSATRVKPEVRDIVREINREKEVISEHLRRLGLLRKLHAPRKERVDVVAVLREVEKAAKPLLQLRGDAFFLGPASGSAFVIGDRENLFVAFDNLVRNAVHFLAKKHGRRSKGHLDITWSVSSGRVTIKVRDDGTGIPASVKSRVFLPFVSTKGRQGLGIGLAVTKLIIENSGGMIAVQSVEGAWTEFTVSLPTAE